MCQRLEPSDLLQGFGLKLRLYGGTLEHMYILYIYTCIYIHIYMGVYWGLLGYVGVYGGMLGYMRLWEHMRIIWGQ